MDDQQLNGLIDELEQLRFLPQSQPNLDRADQIYRRIQSAGIDPNKIINDINRKASTENVGVEAGLLAKLSAEQSSLISQIEKSGKIRNEKSRKLFASMAERRAAEILAQKFQEDLNKQADSQQAIAAAIETKLEAHPSVINENDAKILVDRKIAAGTILSPQQKAQAVAQLTRDLITSTTTTAASVAYLTELAVATANSQSSVIKDIDDSFKTIIRPATQADYDSIIAGQDSDISLDSTGLIITDNKLLNGLLDNPPSLTSTIETNLIQDIASPAYKDSPTEDSLFDTIAGHQQSNTAALENVFNDDTATKVATTTTFTDTKTAEAAILHEVDKQPNPIHRLNPTPTAAAAASFSSSIPPGRGQSDSTTIRLLGRGISPEKIQQAIESSFKERGTKLNYNDKRILAQVMRNVHNFPKGLSKNLLDLAKPNVFGRKLPGFADSFTKSLNVGRNKLAAISTRTAPFIQAAANPIGFVQAQLGARVGKRLATRFAGKVSNATMRQAFKIMGEKGFQAGIQFLGKQAAFKLGSRFMSKAAIKALAQSLNVIPGLGLAVDAAITVALFVKDTLGKVLGQIGTSLYGKPIEVKDLAGAAGLGAAAIGGGIVALGAGATAAMAAVFAAAGAAFTTLFFAAAAAAIFYVAAFNIGPILSTIAQLDSGLGPLGTGSGTYGSGVSAIPNNAALAECGITFASGTSTFSSESYSDWSPSDQQRVEDHVALLYGSSAFKSVMCKPFTFWRAGVSPQGYFGWAAGNFNIVMYSGAFGSDATLLGLLAHEMGHYYEAPARIAFKNQGFVSWGAPQTINPQCSGSEPYVTSCNNSIYPVPRLLTSEYGCYEENFSEYLRFYVINDSNQCNGPGHQQQLSPSGYNWIKDNVFGGVVF